MSSHLWDKLVDRHPRTCDAVTRVYRRVKPYLPPVNFITIHYTFFIVFIIIFSLIFWGSSRPVQSIGWWDSMFMVTSAMTGTGLNTVNVSQLTTFQQVVLAFLMIIGSQAAVSYATVAFRKHIFEKRFEDIVASERAKRRTHKTGAVVGMAGAMIGMQVMSSLGSEPKNKRKSQGAEAPISPIAINTNYNNSDEPLSPKSPSMAEKVSIVEPAGQGQNDQQGPRSPGGRERSSSLQPPSQPPHVGFLEPIREGQSMDNMRPHSATGPSIYQIQSQQTTDTRRRRPVTGESKVSDKFNVQTFLKEQKSSIGRNGQFFNLSSDEREYLGGVEYRCLKFLSIFIPTYIVLWQLFGAIALGAWMSARRSDTAAVNDQNPWWAGIFLAISSYNNTGFTLLDAGFLPFKADYYVLVFVTILSLAGPAAAPVFMRFLIWCMSSLLNLFSRDPRHYHVWKEGFDYILKFPRRVYIGLFPAKATYTFALTFGTFVAIDWVLFLVLSIGNPTMEAIPLGRRIFNALFVGFSIPSGGYCSVPPSSMYPDVWVLWLVVFYTAAYPNIITMRNTNVYEERSLGIYEGDQTEEEQLHSETSSLYDVENTGNDLNLGAGGADLGPIMTNKSKNWDSASQTPSTRSIKNLRAVGRRGTAFVGRQIQNRMAAFNGVGVAANANPSNNNNYTSGSASGVNLPPPLLRRAATLDFSSRASVHSLHDHPPTTARPSLLSQQVRSQLSHDVWWLSLALFIITIIETRHTLVDPQTYSVFNILFEIISGYCTIGISLGVSDDSYSLSGGFYTGSKIIMIFVMLRGRHRGLPVALDRAVRLPGKKLSEYEEEDAQIRNSISASFRGENN